MKSYFELNKTNKIEPSKVYLLGKKEDTWILNGEKKFKKIYKNEKRELERQTRNRRYFTEEKKLLKTFYNT